MNAVTTFPPVKPGAGSEEEDAARAALARLVACAPRVFPGVAVEEEWKAALAQARDALNPKRKGLGQ